MGSGLEKKKSRGNMEGQRGQIVKYSHQREKFKVTHALKSCAVKHGPIYFLIHLAFLIYFAL